MTHRMLRLGRNFINPKLCTLHGARSVPTREGPGSDGITIQQFEINLPKHLRQLSRELAEERYYPLPVQKFMIKKADGGTRELSVLTLKDRIVQRAVCDLISPIYEAKFLESSFAYRPNRGVPHAIAAVTAIRTEGYAWVVHADIEKFFDRMDSHILMRFLRATLKEPAILRLIQMWLDMGGITQPPKINRWYTHIEETIQSLGEGVEQVTNRLLDRTPPLAAPVANMYSEDVYHDGQGVPNYEEWVVDTPEAADQNAPWAQVGKEALVNIGREGFLLLLANAKRLCWPLTAKQLFVAAPLVVAALAAPTVGGMVKDHLNRPSENRGYPGITAFTAVSEYLSAFFSFDKAMARAGIRLVRYADDLLLLCRSERRAQHALAQAQKTSGEAQVDIEPEKDENRKSQHWGRIPWTCL